MLTRCVWIFCFASCYLATVFYYIVVVCIRRVAQLNVNETYNVWGTVTPITKSSHRCLPHYAPIPTRWLQRDTKPTFKHATGQVYISTFPLLFVLVCQRLRPSSIIKDSFSTSLQLPPPLSKFTSTTGVHAYGPTSRSHHRRLPWTLVRMHCCQRCQSRNHYKSFPRQLDLPLWSLRTVISAEGAAFWSDFLNRCAKGFHNCAQLFATPRRQCHSFLSNSNRALHFHPYCYSCGIPFSTVIHHSRLSTYIPHLHFPYFSTPLVLVLLLSLSQYVLLARGRLTPSSISFLLTPSHKYIVACVRSLHVPVMIRFFEVARKSYGL